MSVVPLHNDERAFNKSAGEYIRTMRRRVGMSQRALGAAIGVSAQQMQKFEAGINRMSVYQFAIIAYTLQSALSEIQ